MQIAGDNFGAVPSSAKVYIGQTQATGAKWINDKRIRCTVAAGMGQVCVLVVVKCICLCLRLCPCLHAST